MTQQEGAHLLGVAVGPPTVDWGGGVRGVGEVALALEEKSITDLPLGWTVRRVSQIFHWDGGSGEYYRSFTGMEGQQLNLN